MLALHAVACLVLVASAPSAAAPNADERKLTEILSRREFRAGLRELGHEPRLPEPPRLSFARWIWDGFVKALDRFASWLERLLRRDEPQATGRPRPGSVSPAATRAIAAAAALLALWVLWRVRWKGDESRQGSAVTTLPGGEAMPDALSQPPDVWARFAEQFAREGEWRLALRALYLELLVRLHERGALRYERPRTNGEYASQLRGSPAAEPFALLTSEFDRAWYGDKPFDADAYRAAVAWTRAVDDATAALSLSGAGQP